MKSTRFLTAVISVLVCFVFDVPKALACSYVQYRGIERDSLPFSHGVKLKETPLLSAAIFNPPGGRIGSDCSGMGSFTIFMQSVDTRESYSGYLVFKRTSGIIPSYLKKHFRNAHRINSNKINISFTSKEDRSKKDIRFSYKVKYIDDKGGRTRWSKSYSVEYVGGSDRHFARYYEPELDPVLHQGVFKTAEALVALLQSRSQTPKVLSDEGKQQETGSTPKFDTSFYDLFGKLSDQASTYVGSDETNISVHYVYKDYTEFVYKLYHFKIAQELSHVDGPEIDELIDALDKLRVEKE